MIPKRNLVEFPHMYWVIGSTPETKHLAYAIFETRAEALRWVLAHGRIGYIIWKD
jgi:hypothetical protein